MKKGQITFYIILGIVFIIVFGFLLWVAAAGQDLVTSRDVEQATTDLTQSVALSNFVESCLQEVTVDALISLGEQGGQLADMYTVRRIPFFEKPVAYGILEPEYLQDTPPFPVPRYPRPGKLRLWGEPYYGKVLLPGLCTTDQRVHAETCASFGETGTVEQQLRDYVELHLASCADVTQLQNKVPYKFEVEEIIANVTFGPENVRFSVEYPIVIEFSNGRKQSFLEFSTILPVRFAKMYYFVQELASNEVQDYTSDLGEFELINNFTEGFVVKQIQGPCRHCTSQRYDDVVVVRDTKSMLDGKPYTFQFAVENRIPVLDFLHHTPMSRVEDIIVEVGEIIFLDPVGYDPDGDELEYRFEGWKAAEFHSSAEFLLTQQNATYRATVHDIGTNEVIVIVRDNEGKEDFQLVTIRVLDQPFFAVGGGNMLGLPGELASIEDPYILSVDLSCAACNLQSLLWQLFHTGSAGAYHEIDTNQESVLVNPQQNILKRDSQFSGVGDKVSVDIRTSSGNVREEFEELQVLECLPYSSSEKIFPYNGASPTSDEAFLGSHSCCQGDLGNVDAFLDGTLVPGFGEFASSSTLCHEETGKNVCHPSFGVRGPSVAIYTDTGSGDLQELELTYTLDESDPSLIAYYSFDDSTVLGKDSSSYARHGISTGVRSVPGVKGTAGLFEETASIDFSQSLASQLQRDISVEFWLKPTLHHPLGGTPILSFGAFTATIWPVAGVTKANAGVSVQTPQGTVWGGGHYTPGQYLQLGIWYHYVFTYNGTHQRLYENGVAAGGSAYEKQVLGTLVPVTHTKLGGPVWNVPSVYFNGILDEIRIYNRVLQSDEIRQHYRGDVSAVPTLLLNDIYKRDFTQRCSGTRGNVCAGEIDLNIVHFQSCGDKDVGSLEDESCSGPPGTVFTCASGVGGGCINYLPGRSFEKTFLQQPTADGICNNNFAQSTKYVYGTASGKMKCQGRCDGRGGCTNAYNCVCESSYGADSACDERFLECAGSQGYCGESCGLERRTDSYDGCKCVAGNQPFNFKKYWDLHCGGAEGAWREWGGKVWCSFADSSDRQKCETWESGSTPIFCHELKPEYRINSCRIG